MPRDTSKKLQVDTTKTLDVRFKTDAVVATWWVHLVVKGQAVRTWTGRTNDAAADQAIIPAADLKPGRTVLWQLALFGSQHASIDYQMEIEFRQQGAMLGSDSKRGTLEKGKTRGLSGARVIEAKS